jgi:transposase InsO family protein
LTRQLKVVVTKQLAQKPKTPKMNAHCERFNRNIQECFVDYHENLLLTDPALFNQKMSDWLVFYNTELPHLSPKPNPKKKRL